MGSQRPQRGLGAAIAELRERAGLSRRGLAIRSGVSARWLAQLEAGRVDPTWARARRIATGLGTSLEELAAEAERLEESEPG